MSTTPSPSPDAPTQPEPTRPWFKKKRYLIPGALVALLVVGALLSDPEDEAASDSASSGLADVSDSTDDDSSETDPAASADEDEPTDTTEAEVAAESDPEPAAPFGTREAPLPLGQTAQVGDDWEVAVVGFTPDATAEVLAANQFNDPPGEGEVYALVRLRATYVGDSDGTAAWELSAGYLGDDGRIYVDHDCNAVKPDALLDQPTVVAGGTVEGNFCLRLPQAVLGTGAVFVEPLIGFDDAKVWWEES